MASYVVFVLPFSAIPLAFPGNLILYSFTLSCLLSEKGPLTKKLAHPGWGRGEGGRGVGGGAFFPFRVDSFSDGFGVQ